MKKIIQPEVRQYEKADYFCDITGVPMGDQPHARLTIVCGYGSSRDLTEYRLELSDKGLEEIMKLLRARMYPKTMQSFGYEASLVGDPATQPTSLVGPEDQMTFHELLNPLP